MESFFLNKAGRLRSGWRLGIFALVYIAILFLLSSAVRVIYALALNMTPGRVWGHSAENIVFRLVLLIAALSAGWICGRWLEDLPWRALGLTFHPGWLRDLAVGSLIGAVSIILAIAIAAAGHGLSFVPAERGMMPQVTQTLFLTAGLFILAALAEEALFRGYPLQTLTRAGLAWLAIVLTSIPFAAVHLKNPNVVKGFTFINTALAGVWLGIAYLRTRSLWFPLGVHWSWNWMLGSVFGLPVSGITDIAPQPLLQGRDIGPAWLTGGAYGIEGGLACTITLLVSIVFIWRTRLVSATEEMKRLTSEENRVRRTQSTSILPDANQPT
jgi:CAAX protease family protein